MKKILLTIGLLSFFTVFASIKEKPFFSAQKYRDWQADLETRLAKNPERLDLAKILVGVAILNEDFQVAHRSNELLLKQNPQDAALRLDEIRLLSYLHELELCLKKIEQFVMDFPQHEQIKMLQERKTVIADSVKLNNPQLLKPELLPLQKQNLPVLSVYALKQPQWHFVKFADGAYLYDDNDGSLKVAFDFLQQVNDKTLKNKKLVNAISFVDFSKVPRKLYYDFSAIDVWQDEVKPVVPKDKKAKIEEKDFSLQKSQQGPELSVDMKGLLEKYSTTENLLAKNIVTDIGEDQKNQFSHFFQIENIYYNIDDGFFTHQQNTYLRDGKPVEIVAKETLTFLHDSLCKEFTIDPWQRFMVASCLNQQAEYQNYDLQLFIRKDNKWQKSSQPAFAKVNSIYHERMPNISQDGRFLTFSSNGHAGYGGYDFMVSEISYRDEKNSPLFDFVNFGEVKNISPQVNSYHEEFDFFALHFNQKSFLLKRKYLGEATPLKYNTKDIKDISYQVANVIPVKFKVLSEKETNPYIELELIAEAFDQRAPLKLTFTRESPYLPLIAGAKYSLKVKSRGTFYSLTELQFEDLIKNDENTGVIKYLYLKEIKAQSSVVAKGLQFEKRSWEILPSMQLEIESVISLLKENPEIILMIEGHTDNVGDEKYNLELSEQRANSVKQELIKKGIDEKRLLSKGFGLSAPIASNATEEGRAKNRRTEFKVHELK